MSDIPGSPALFQSRLRVLIERHKDLSISELGRRIGHKTGTAISALISSSKSGRDDLRLSTFLKICSELAKAYEGRMTEREIALFLLGFPVSDMVSLVQSSSFEYPLSRAGGKEEYPIELRAE